jgi:site-specific DNA recombinase
MGGLAVKVKKLAEVVADAPKLGVLYLRVSSRGQLAGDYDPLGQSIPTQRQECTLLAKSDGVQIVKEFIDPGRSATTTEKRAAFIDVMAYVRAHPEVRFIYVYSRSRLFRNEFDAAIVKHELHQRGVRIVSKLDPTDDSPVGMMIAGMIDVVNAFQSRSQGADIALKMQGKVERGGSIARAALGYLNVRQATDDGREIRTIAVDYERRDLVELAFRLYATGTHSYDSLLEAVTDAGLRTRPTKQYPAGRPMSRHKIEQMLQDRFYIGEVRFKGQWYPGRHEPIIERSLFDRVQEVRREHGGGDGTRMRRHHHYLKGAAYCPRCGSRYLYVPGKSKSGAVYFYFVCAMKHHGSQCDMPYLRQADVERAVEDHYASLRVPADVREQIARGMAGALGAAGTMDGQLQAQYARQIADVDRRIDALLDLVGDPAWPTEKLTAKVAVLREDQERARRKLAELDRPDLEAGKAAVTALVELLDRPQDLYRIASDRARKVLNEVFFTRLYVEHDDDAPRVSRDQVTEYLAPLVEVSRAHTNARNANGATVENGGAGTVTRASLLATALAGGCSSKTAMVDLRGFEPLTPSMRTRCATGLRYRP